MSGRPPILPRRRAFSIVELLTVLACLGVIFMFMVVVAARRERRGFRHHINNRSNVIGLLKASVIYAGSNKEYFPGRDSTGRCVDNQPIAPAPSIWGAAAIGDSPTAASFGDYVVATLLNDGCVAPNWLINPYGTNPKVQPTQGTGNCLIHSDAHSGQYSYAMLAGVADTKASDGQPMQRHAGLAVFSEWKDNSRSNAVIFGDRLCTAGGGTAVLSMQGCSGTTTAKGSGVWKGALCYGDAHCETQSTCDVSQLRYGKNGGDSPAHADGGVFRAADCDDPSSFAGATHTDPATGKQVFDSGFLWCPVRE